MQTTNGQMLEVGGLTVAKGGKIVFGADEVVLAHSNGNIALSGTTLDPTVSASKLPAGDRLIAGNITQSTSVALTGTLDRIYMRATAGDTGGAGTIRGAEVGARLDDSVTGAVAAVVTGGYFWADAKTKEATILRGVEVSLDGGAGGTSTTAQGVVIFNNSSATQTTSIGVDVNGGTASGHKAFTYDIRLQNGETIDNATNGTVHVNTAVLKQSFDALAYWTATVADGGGVTFAAVSDGTASFTFSQPTAFSSTLKQQGESVVLNQRHRVTTAEINAGHTMLAAVTGLKYRVIDCKAIAYGGAVGAVTSVDLKGTQGTSVVVLCAFAQGSLTQSAVVAMGETGSTVLADGASYAQNDAATAITLIKNGSDITTATGVDIILTYALEA